MLKEINAEYIISLICKIYKRRKKTSLLRTIPFLTSLANFCFTHGYLTDQQKISIFNIYSVYKTEKDIQKKTSTL